MGLGLLGRGVGDAEYLAECGAQLIVTDLKTSEQLATSLERLSRFENITYVLGKHRFEDFENVDFVLKAAGVPLESPYIAHAKEKGTPVHMSADLFARISGVSIIGITGTRGKSTVTQMIYEILVADGRKVLLGGNVRGVSTLALLKEVTPEHVAVLELDSWQCHGFGEARISPHIAVFTTFMDDHLSYYHNDVAAYLKDKAQIFLHQTKEDTLILGSQVAPLVLEHYKQAIQSTIVLPKGIAPEVTLSIPGEHNRYNAALAQEAARLVGVSEECILQTLQTFKGVPGRLQLVREVGGVLYYNDTNSTTPEAALAALGALGDKKNIILIMGGHDKNLNMRPLIEALPTYTKRVLLLSGTGTNRILSDIPDASVFDSLAGAFTEARAYAREGDIVLLSPAFSSFGMFVNEYDRGDQFVALVEKL